VAYQSPVATLSTIPIIVPASNYWNPFGPVTFANGTANPNRLSGLNISSAGVPITISNYLFNDFGPMRVDVTNRQYRALVGLKGEFHGFNWESALSYSEAWARDVSDNISRTKLQQYLALSTSDAYNIFGTSVNKQSTIDAMRQQLTRYTKSTLASYDFRLSKKDLFTLPGGNVGMAAGVEARRETQLDQRDDRINGTITFTDPTSGVVYGDFVNSAINPSTAGSREVFRPMANLPCRSSRPNEPAHGAQRGCATGGRYEHYSDFGNVAVPKVAASWEVVKGVRLRGSWAKSFRAPNLEQVNATVVTRANTRTDYIFCEADLRAGRISSFSACTRSQATSARRAGNPNLDPEKATTLSAGIVLEPPLPPSAGNLTFTADWWKVRQTGLVGVFGEGNALILDYLLRQQGSSNPNVIRAAPTASDVEAFAGTGLTPAGQVLYVNDQYTNLLPQTVEGLDLNLTYRTPPTAIGRFSVSVNASHFFRYYQEPRPGSSNC
jgi:hypothetical protein